MDTGNQVLEYAKILILLSTGFALVYVLFLVARFLAPRKPTPEKLSTYECGEDPVGNSWFQVNSRFYVIALIFLLFDVEMVFIFPWSVVFGDKTLIEADPRWGWLTFAEMMLFVGILLLGLIYLWVKGDLEWIKPHPKKPSVLTGVPLSAYAGINQEIYQVKAFDAQISKPDPAPTENRETPAPKPAFKPVFRRPAP